ncbi:rhodanese-like domain-containing protein [Eggerthella sp. HF-4214]|uniref:Rhodanese-like domain-containing protein n=2 Tax=Eggerthella guodeyinii TaxID=2690837 RepID=A0A6N7RQG1_9ACTN|nr:rhodanese-like domain-containing protein [Eggerthella guodeyinii]
MGALALAGCAADAGEGEAAPDVQVVTAAEAHDLMTSDRVVVLDVRTQQEYDASHIVNARLLPHDAIDAESAAAAAPDKDALVLVYCRTGVRSAEASAKLAELGYTQVRDFGGIESWPYATVDAEDGEGAGTVINDDLPVGVKVVCGKTKPVPDA